MLKIFKKDKTALKLHKNNSNYKSKVKDKAIKKQCLKVKFLDFNHLAKVQIIIQT